MWFIFYLLHVSSPALGRSRGVDATDAVAPTQLMNESSKLLHDNLAKASRTADMSKEMAADASDFASMAKQFAASSQKRSWW